MKKLILLCTVFCCLSQIYAQQLKIPSIEFSPRHYICLRTDVPINIDGNINEASWQKAPWTEYFVDIEGPQKSSPRFNTRVKMLWDNNYFYVAAGIQDPDIWGTLVNHDDVIFYDNDFEIFIDPDGDTHCYAEFEMNALNTVWDLLLIKPYRDIEKAALTGWDIKGLKTGVKIYGTLNNPLDKDSCWTIEAAFPWAAFKEITLSPVPPLENDQWRINFSRVEWQTDIKNSGYIKKINPANGKTLPEDNWVWSPQGLINMHYPEMWGYVQFSGEQAGGEKIIFINREEEGAKLLLRRIYYAERNYFAMNGKFTAEMSLLNLHNLNPGNFTNPRLECTDTTFEASVSSADGNKIISIKQDGLVVVSVKK